MREIDLEQFTPATEEDATVRVEGLTIIPLDTPTLGDRSYLVHDGLVAIDDTFDNARQVGLPLVGKDA